jgi:hypothetical protein
VWISRHRVLVVILVLVLAALFLTAVIHLNDGTYERVANAATAGRF